MNQSKTSSSSKVSFARSRLAIACCSDPPEQCSMIMCSVFPMTKEPRYSVMLAWRKDFNREASFWALSCSSAFRCSSEIFFATNRSPVPSLCTSRAQPKEPDPIDLTSTMSAK